MATTSQTAVARRDAQEMEQRRSRADEIREVFENRAGQFAGILPPQIPPERFVRIAVWAIQRDKKLLACTNASLFDSCLRAAHDGLLPDGREGAIVPYGDNEDGQKKSDVAVWMPMIEGLRKRVRNSGALKDWNVEVVQEGDAFSIRLGDDPHIMHEPSMTGGRTRPVIGAYSIATYPDGSKSREFMNIDQIEDVRRATSKAKKGPWSNAVFYPEMCRKTVGRLHFKQLPKSSDLDDIMRREDEQYDALDAGRTPSLEAMKTRTVTGTKAALDHFASDAQPDTAADGSATDRGDGEKASADAGQQHQDTRTTTNSAASTSAAKTNGQASNAVRSEAVTEEGAKTDSAAWDLSRVPTTESEYLMLAAAKADAAEESGLLREWWGSAEQRKLRNTANVTKVGFEKGQKIIDARCEALDADDNGEG